MRAAAATLAAIAALCLLAGAALLVVDADQRDADGYFAAAPVTVSTMGYAITSDGLDLGTDDTVEDVVARVRVRASSHDGAPVFVGIARSRDLQAYLAGVARTRISDVRNDHTPVRHDVPGGRLTGDPRAQPFWQAVAGGRGPQTIEWEPKTGNWAIAVLNPDGSRRVDADVQVAAGTDVLRWIAFGLLGGAVLTGGAAIALVVARRRS